MAKTTKVTESTDNTQTVEKKVEEKNSIKKKKYNISDVINCKSVRSGKMVYISKKSGLSYEWLDYGDLCEVEYGDLLALKSSKSVFLFEPWFIIQDDFLAKQWGLDGIYKYFEDLDDVESFINSVNPSELREKLQNAPKGYRDTIVYTAGDMVRNGRLDSLAKIRAIDAVAHTKLTSMVGE